MYWTFLLCAISATVAGQGLLKAGASAGTLLEQMRDTRTILGLVIYGGASLLYIVALRRIPLSVALPCTALSYIAVALIGHFVFKETLGFQHMFGLAMIGAGVLVLATS